MTGSYQTTATNTLFVRESPKVIWPAQSPVFTLTPEGGGTITAAETHLYLNGNGRDVSATNLTGSTAIDSSGKVITTKTVTGLVGGNEYTMIITFTKGGVDGAKACTILVRKPGF